MASALARAADFRVAPAARSLLLIPGAARAGRHGAETATDYHPCGECTGARAAGRTAATAQLRYSRRDDGAVCELWAAIRGPCATHPLTPEADTLHVQAKLTERAEDEATATSGGVSLLEVRPEPGAIVSHDRPITVDAVVTSDQGSSASVTVRRPAWH